MLAVKVIKDNLVVQTLLMFSYLAVVISSFILICFNTDIPYTCVMFSKASYHSAFYTTNNIMSKENIYVEILNKDLAWPSSFFKSKGISNIIYIRANTK